METLQDLFLAGEERYKNEDYWGALKIFRLVIEVMPFDFETRFRIASCLEMLGNEKLAAGVYSKLGIFLARGGLALKAILAFKLAEKIAPQLEVFIDEIAKYYCSESSFLGKGGRLSTPQRNMPLNPQVKINLDYDFPPEELMVTTAHMSACIEGINYPDKLPPVPIFSELPCSDLTTLLKGTTLKKYDKNEYIIKQGEKGDNFYMILDGIVEVIKERENEKIVVANLSEGAIFGEMSYFSNRDRTASVKSIVPLYVLEFNPSMLKELIARSPKIGEVFQKFVSERVLNNLLTTNPLFRPFDRDRKIQLLKRFIIHKLPQDTVMVREGEEGRGLYVILGGTVEISKKDEHGDTVVINKLGPGDVFGEISLIYNQPTTASVKGIEESVVMFLPKEYFQALVIAIPEAKEYFINLSDQRILDTHLKLAAESEEIQFDEENILV